MSIESSGDIPVVSDQQERRCAVIYNPAKIDRAFRTTVDLTLTQNGWRHTLWLETTKEDPGVAMTQQAVSERVDRVIGAGGDGTVRVIADGLAGTGIPLGVIPAGTGNLLARNLDLPLGHEKALIAALSDRTRTIDLISIQVDDGQPQHSAGMAGVGVDAMIMDETNPDLKDKVGSAAYFAAAPKALGRLPMNARITIDDRRPIRRKALVILVANFGELQGGISLLPDARPDDGLLDVFIASPHSARDWVRLVLRFVLRRNTKADPVDALRGRRVTISLDQPDNYQLDGDEAGECTTLVAEVRPGALQICY